MQRLTNQPPDFTMLTQLQDPWPVSVVFFLPTCSCLQRDGAKPPPRAALRALATGYPERAAQERVH